MGAAVREQTLQLGAVRRFRALAFFFEAFEDLESLGVGLKHPVLDPVVNHLGEVSCARVPEVCVSVRGREGLEDRLDVLEGVCVAPYHGAVADVVAPDAS